MRRARCTPPAGLTLIEVLILVVIAAILVSMAISRLTGGGERASVTAMTEALRRVAERQEEFRRAHGRYARSVGELGLAAPGGMTITLGGTELDRGVGFHAVASDSAHPSIRCVLAVGGDTTVAGIGVRSGEVACR
ncbi:MAG TPA: hypothetical protein VNK43_12425 [Gemmatimonadales bacterium]|nr:hypothetical protein [Gemmatimonadales bacterium]